MPPRFIPIGRSGGMGGGFQGRFQPLGGGGTQTPRFLPAPRPAPSFPQLPHQPSVLPGILGNAGALAGFGGFLSGGNPVPPGGVSQGNLSGAIAGGLGAASGALNLAQGRTVPGAIQTAGGLTQLAGSAPGLSPGASSALGAAGSTLGAAGAGYALSRGDAFGGVTGLISSIAPLLGAPGVGLLAGGTALAAALVHGLASGADYTQGDLSKAIMQARQTALREGSVGAVDRALKSAPSYPQMLQVLSQLPPGTGQLQYGSGPQYTGETTLGGPALTQTPGWQQTLAQAQQDPANFIKNFWVQTGQSGATNFNPGATRQWQNRMIESLPPGDLKTSLLDWLQNFGYADPRDPQAVAAYQQWLTGGRQGPSPRQSADAARQIDQWSRQAVRALGGLDLGMGPFDLPPYTDLVSQLGAFNISPDQAGTLLKSAGLQPPPLLDLSAFAGVQTA